MTRGQLLAPHDIRALHTNLWQPSTVLAETYSVKPGSIGNNAALTSAQLFLVGTVISAGTVCTNITFHSATTALSAGTNQWFALYDKNLALLRVTADDTSTAWAANAAKILALATTYTTTTTDRYYLGIMVKATTVPTLGGMSHGNVATNTPMSLAPIYAGTSTGSLTNPASAPDPAAALTASNIIPYAYIT